jgi:hypothetical protein
MIKSSITNTEDLTRDHQGANASGIRSLRLVPAHLVKWINPLKAKLLPGDVVLNPSTFPTSIDITADSCSWSEDMTETAHGVLYRTSISFQIPKERPALRNWMFANRQVRWIAFTQDRNGQYRIHGSIGSPLRLGSSASPGAGRSGRSSRSFGVSGEGLLPAQYLTAINNDFFQERPFTQEFDSLTFN